LKHTGGTDVKPFLFHLALAIALAGAAPVSGAEPARQSPTATAQPSKETTPREKLICTKHEVAGSLIPKRVCETQKQRDAQLEAIQDLNKERRELGGTRTEGLGMVPSR
jgi:hypothetical protein